jgi:uncharacterized membrane protein YhaH (DUF805 family)
MGFVEAISAGFRNYVNFSTRASRSEYWYWVLFVVLVSIAAAIIDLLIAPHSPIGPATGLVYLALLLPELSVAVRRLHDTDRSGWWLLLGFIPLIGAIVLIVWFCTRGTMGQNRFGSDPLGA